MAGPASGAVTVTRVWLNLTTQGLRLGPGRAVTRKEDAT